MQRLIISSELEQKLSVAAQHQGKTIDEIVNRLIREYLEDLEDARLAEVALRRIEAGESNLVEWEEAKKELHGLEN